MPGGVHQQGVPDVIAAEFDRIQGIGRGNAANLSEKRLHLRRQVEVQAVLVGSRPPTA